MIKTRFAPSPTGFVHVGNLRTALYAYLIAKQNEGVFVVRIEDTDQTRFVTGSVESVLRSLKWAGIEPDEGVLLNENNQVVEVGELGPYFQSKRLSIYQKYAQQLVDQGDAYYCFCSEERLEEVRKIQELNKQPSIYDGFCRKQKPEDSKVRIKAGESHVIRMKMPKEGETEFVDLIRGKVSFKNELIDDQIIIKSDGFPTYHFAVVVDDHLMKITHAIRGEDWLSSTPKHLQLYKYFGWQSPLFAHLPLLLNADKSKLSKRQGDVAVEDYIKKGYLSEAVVNFMAFMGWNPGTEKEVFSLDELVKEFRVDKVSKSGAVFNLEKLDWYNKQHMIKMDLKELAKRAKTFFVNQGLDAGNAIKNLKLDTSEADWLQKVVTLEKERATTLVELVENVRFIFAEKLDYEPELLIWKKSDKEKTIQNLTKLSQFIKNLPTDIWQNKGELESRVMEWIKENELGNGDVLWPMRVALSGQKNSPGPVEIAIVLGREETLNRVSESIKKL